MSSQIRRPSAPRLFAAALALAAVSFVALPARANNDIRKELHEVCQNLKAMLEAENEAAIRIGAWNGPGNFPASSGPGIAKLLSEELEKIGIQVRSGAKYGVHGEYHMAEILSTDESDARIGVKMVAVKLNGKIEDSNGKILTGFNFERTVPGEATIVELMGLPVHLPPDATPRDRDRKVRKALIDPPTTIAGPLVKSSPDSPYGLRIHVDGTPCDARRGDDSSLAFVPIRRGQTYAVELVNESQHEAAVRLSIDGLNMYSFSELRVTKGDKKGEPIYTTVIVPARGSSLIPGWHRTNEKSDSFLVTKYADSAAAMLNVTQDVGTITATFAAAWPEGSRPPSDEPGTKRSLGSGDATGFGPRISVKYEEVRRNLGVIRDTVCVRYTK